MQSNLPGEQNLHTYIDRIKQQKPSAEQDLKMERDLLARIENYANSHQAKTQYGSQQAARQPNWLEVSGAFLFTKLNWNTYSLLGSFTLVCLLSLSVFLSSGVNSPAFASVVDKLGQISSMYYKANMKSNGQSVMQLEVYYQAPSQLRVESTPAMANNDNQGAIINILDTNLGQGMILIPANKLAMPFEFNANQRKDSPDKNPLYWLDAVKQYQGEVVNLAPKTLNAQEVVGYEIYVSNMTVTLWVNINTEWPVQIEIMMDKINGQSPFEFVADVEFNQYIDPNLLSLQPSDEYSRVQGDE